MKKFYAENYLRVKYIQMPLKDGEGNLLKSEGKAEIKAMADDFMARLAKKSAVEKDLMAEFDYLDNENSEYISSVSAAAVTTTDENGSTITTETTAKKTTAADTTKNTDDTDDTDKTAETTAETTAEVTETTTETTTAGTNETTDTTATAAEGETTETTAETTTAAETTKGSDESDKSTESGETTETTATTATTGETTEDTTVSTKSIGYDVSYERTLRVSTAGEKENEETETEPTYTPNKEIYEWFADSATPFNTPKFFEEDENYYIAMKMDIKNRMTDDDLWNKNNIENVRREMYYDEFKDMIDDMGKELPTERNKSAFNRYDVLDVDVVAYQNAMMQSYYDYYSNYGGLSLNQ